MDLLEIRKKAKQKKEAEEKAALETPDREKEPAGGAAPEKPAAKGDTPPAVKRPKKKAAKGRTAKAAAKPRKPTFPEGPSSGPGKHEPPVADEAPLKGSVQAAEEIPETPVSRSSAAKTASIEAGPAPEAGAFQAPEGEVFGEAGEAAEDAGNIVEYLAFMLADEEYAVKVEDVKEIIRLQQITKVPRADDFVEGIISLRGVIIPVFDIKKRLGLEHGERQRTVRIVIVSEDGNPQGIIVDKVTGVARLREDSIEPPPAVIGGVEGEYLEGVGRIGDRLLILFNTGKVLSMEGGVAR